MQQPAKLGMALFLVSESVFFFMLLLAFVIFRNRSVTTAAELLNLRLTSFYTVCLLASSFTVWRAARTTCRQQGGRTRPWLAGTIVLGLVFLLGQGGEYLRILHRGATVSEDLFGTTFFTLAGIHGLHVLIGLLLLVAMLWITEAGVPCSAWPAVAVQAVSSFWLFLGGVWVVIFSVLYLWTFL